MNKLILVFLIAVLLMAAMPAAAEAQDSCYPHDVAHVRILATIRISYDDRSRKVRTVRRDEAFDVIGSKQGPDYCWVEVTEGWVRSGTVSPEPREAPPICYPDDVAIAIRRTALREYAGWAGVTLRDAQAGEQFAVTGSRMSRDECWVNTSEGWLYGELVAPAPAAPATNPALGESCYTDSHLYLTGTVNIRRGPSTDRAVVGQARSGDVLEVTESSQGETYCWAKVYDGWIAQTARVRSNIGPLTEPLIEGEKEFVDRIRAALHYLRDLAPEWYAYVVQPTRVIAPAPPDRQSSSAVGRESKIRIHSKHLAMMMQLAHVLVHEACHLIQSDEGRGAQEYDYDTIARNERECTVPQVRMIEAIDPRHSELGYLRDRLTWSISKWRYEIRRSRW